MLNTTDAIVLSLQPHSDKAHLLHAYTRTHGRVNYMVYGLGRKHPIGLYTPFTLLSITAEYPPASSSKPPTLKEATRIVTNNNAMRIPNGSPDIYKQTIALFVSEVLFHTLPHPMSDERLFDFIASSAKRLEVLANTEDAAFELANFHIHFLVGLAEQLGYGIEADSPLSALIGSSSAPLSRAQRQEQLHQLCTYFDEHVETWQTPRSLDVLMEVFD